MWLADGMIVVELASLIASAFAIIGFALGCFLMEDKLFRRMYGDKPQNTKPTPPPNRKNKQGVPPKLVIVQPKLG